MGLVNSSEQLLSDKFRNMAFLCAVLVVFIHVPCVPECDSSLWWMREIVAFGVARIAVPFFFFSSGYFLARHFQDRGYYRKELAKRLFSIVVPFAFWNVVMLAMMLFKDYMVSGSVAIFFSENTYLKIMGLDLFQTPLVGPLWYLRALFLLVLICPILQNAVRRKTPFLITAYVLYWLCVAMPDNNIRRFFGAGFSLEGLFYFTVGIIFQTDNLHFQLLSLGRSHRWLLGSIGILILFIKSCLECCDYRAVGLNPFFIPFLLVFVWSFIPTSVKFRNILACSFPVFLMHQLILSTISCMLKVNTVGTMFLSAFAAILCSVGISLSVRRYFPKMACIMFGGRR